MQKGFPLFITLPFLMIAYKQNDIPLSQKQQLHRSKLRKKQKNEINGNAGFYVFY